MSRSSIAAMALSVGLASAFVPVVLPEVAIHGVQTVTAADQVVYLPGCEYATRTQNWSDNVVTTTVSSAACPTGLGSEVVGCNGVTFVAGGPVVVIYRTAVHYVEVYEKAISCPFNELGPNAFPGWNGTAAIAGCSTCVAGQQNAYVKECSNGNCAAYKCYYGMDGSYHCDSHQAPNGYLAAPPGCEVVTAYYPDCGNGYCQTRSDCYTVPVAAGFPVVFPPNFCNKCLAPPGWVQVIEGTVTFTRPTTTASSTAAPTATGAVNEVSCPNDDRQVYVGESGSTFLIECNVGVTGVEINQRRAAAAEERSIAARALGTTVTFNACIQLCDNIQTCEAVSYNPNSDVCQGYADATVTPNPNGNWVATIIRRANPITSASTTPATTFTPTVIVPSSTPTTPVQTTAQTTTAITSSSVILTTSSSVSSAPVTTPPSNTASATASSTSSSTSADPSSDLQSNERRREQLVPKRQVGRKAGAAGDVERRAGRIVSPHAEKDKKDTIRL